MRKRDIYKVVDNQETATKSFYRFQRVTNFFLKYLYSFIVLSTSYFLRYFNL